MNTNKLIIENINERLARRGRSLDGRPILKIVWSGDQYEFRIGTFSDYYGSIFLREYTALKEVPKYWHIKPPCWVLERLTYLPPNAAAHKELVSGRDSLDIHRPTVNGTYEPLYAFRNVDTGEQLEVNDRIVDVILYHLEQPIVKKSDSQMHEDYIAEVEADIPYFLAELDNAGRSPLFAFENSAFIDSKKRLTYDIQEAPDAVLR